eukprot:1753_1
MNPYFAVIPALLLILLSMVLLFINLSYKFIKHRKNEKNKIHLILVITTICCFICGTFSVTFHCIHLWLCYHRHPPQSFKSCYIHSIHSKIADTFFYIVHLSLYIHLIYGRLKIALSGTCYGYSNKQLFIVSIPIYITVPCIIIYQLDSVFTSKHLELIQKIALIVTIIIDSYLNMSTCYLFVKALKNVIMAQSFSFEDYMKPNYLENDNDHDDAIKLQYSSGNLLLDEQEEDIDIDCVVSRNLRKITFTDTPIEQTIHVITRVTTLSCISILSNEMYFITVLIWLFFMDKENYTDIWISTVSIGRALDIFVNVLLLYLFVYRYNYKMYHCLCDKCDTCCYQCTKNSTKRQFITRSVTNLYIQ